MTTTALRLLLDDRRMSMPALLDMPHGADVVEYALALMDLGRGRWTEALDRLESLDDPTLGILTVPDRIEAAVRAGRTDEASSLLHLLEEWDESGACRSQHRLASCRALLSDGDDATMHFEEALALAADGHPFDGARIRLLYGEHLRRSRQRSASRVQLRAALESFEALRAEPWAERARAELRASGESARRRDPSTIDQLTPQELQVASYVAQGMANKEVAARLFLSPRTIDSHLRSIFAKLGITSRTQLARLQFDEDLVGMASTLAIA
jgi:DNA-binding CsgD family transcriptional regulator